MEPADDNATSGTRNKKRLTKKANRFSKYDADLQIIGLSIEV